MRESIFSPASALPATWPSGAVRWPLPYTSTSAVTLGDASDWDASLEAPELSAGKGSVVASVPVVLAPSTAVPSGVPDASTAVAAVVLGCDMAASPDVTPLALPVLSAVVGAAASFAVAVGAAACAVSASLATTVACSLDYWASACAAVVAVVVAAVGCVAVGSVAYAATGVPTSARPMTTAILADLPDAKYK